MLEKSWFCGLEMYSETTDAQPLMAAQWNAMANMPAVLSSIDSRFASRAPCGTGV